MNDSITTRHVKGCPKRDKHWIDYGSCGCRSFMCGDGQDLALVDTILCQSCQGAVDREVDYILANPIYSPVPVVIRNG